jgi:hypothetical protein
MKQAPHTSLLLLLGAGQWRDHHTDHSAKAQCRKGGKGNGRVLQIIRQAYCTCAFTHTHTHIYMNTPERAENKQTRALKLYLPVSTVLYRIPAAAPTNHNDTPLSAPICRRGVGGTPNNHLNLVSVDFTRFSRLPCD